MAFQQTEALSMVILQEQIMKKQIAGKQKLLVAITLLKLRQINYGTAEKNFRATYSNAGGTLTGFEIQVLKKDGVKTNDADWTTLQVLGVTTGQTTADFNLGNYLNDDFFINYTTGTTVSLRAVASAKTLHAFTMNNVTSEGEGHYTVTATYGGVDAFTNRAPDGAEVVVTVKADDYYTLSSVTVGGNNATISGNTATYTVTSVTAATEVKVDVRKTEYNLDIQFQNLQGVTLDANLVDTLIQNSTATMSVESQLPAVIAKTDVDGYRFVGWKLLGMDGYLASTDGTIDGGYVVHQADFSRYLSASNKFSIIAVYQRQYSLNVTLNNQFGAAFASEYELHYTDENGEKQVLTNITTTGDGTTTLLESGSYMIDESTFIQLKVKPNKRVSVVEPENEQFGNNIVYIYLTGNKDVTLDFVIRPLEIKTSILNVDAPTNSEGLPANQLAHAISYTVKNELGQVIGSSQEGTKLNINDRVSFGCTEEVLQSGQFRFVEMRVWNVQNKVYDVIALNNAGELTVDDTFFDTYVDENGQVDASMKVIKQYKAEILGENLVSSDNYTLGSYTVEILDETNAIADPSRYQVKEENKSYVLDNGLQLVIRAKVENDYADFSGFTGLFTGEAGDEVTAVAKISDNRAINLRFEKATYTIEAPYNATVGGSLEFTKSFQLGDTISISYTPKNNYQITDWKLVGKALADLGAEQVGNTITIKVTEEFLKAMENAAVLNSEKLTLNSDINTMMNPTLFYGIIGGGAVILILFGTVLLLVLRSKKLKKQKEENERKLNDIQRKFNIAGTIKDLKNS